MKISCTYCDACGDIEACLKYENNGCKSTEYVEYLHKELQDANLLVEVFAEEFALILGQDDNAWLQWASIEARKRREGRLGPSVVSKVNIVTHSVKQ